MFICGDYFDVFLVFFVFIREVRRKNYILGFVV